MEAGGGAAPQPETPPGGAAQKSSPGVRRVVALTLGSVVLATLVLGGLVLGYFTWTERSDDLRVAETKAAKLERENSRLTAEVSRLKRKASAEYRRGFDAGEKFIEDTNREFGLDYDAGYNAAFGGFGTWQTDTYYFVHIAKGEGKLKYDITSRGRFEPCTAYFVRGDSIWTQDGPC